MMTRLGVGAHVSSSGVGHARAARSRRMDGSWVAARAPVHVKSKVSCGSVRRMLDAADSAESSTRRPRVRNNALTRRPSTRYRSAMGGVMRGWSWLVLAGLATGCGSSPTTFDDTGRCFCVDAARDIDAFRPDTGPPPPPVCTGTAVACTMRTDFDCARGRGCAVEHCYGHPDACETQFTAEICRLVRGCAWDGSSCYGDPNPCTDFNDFVSCTSQGCGWDDSPSTSHCRGTATECVSLGSSDCAAQPGCVPLVDGGLDAGRGADAAVDAGNDAAFDAGHDAASIDAGPDGGHDAGPPCVVSGACSPFDSGSCPSGQTCVFNRGVPSCAVPGTVLEGGQCYIGFVSLPTCAAGLLCTGSTSSGLLTCQRPCHHGTLGECGATARCAMAGYPPAPEFPPSYPASTCAWACVSLPPFCDPVSPTCAMGSGCYVESDVEVGAIAVCRSTHGTTPIDGTCTYSNDCAPGGTCIGARCVRICRVDTDCTSTRRCTGTESTGHYSFCR